MKQTLKKILTWLLNRVDFTPQRFFKTDAVKKVLVVKLCCIGDIVQTTPALKALKLAGKEVHYLCNPWVADIVDMVPFVDKKHVMEQKKPASVLSAISVLRKEKFDLIINFHRDPVINVFLAMCGAKNTAGFNWHGQGVFLTNKFEFDPSLHEIDRYLGMVAKLGFPPADDSTELRRPEMPEKRLPAKENRVRVAVFPGGGQNPGTVMPTKRWPVENFAQLAGLYLKEGKEVWAIGGDSDKDVIDCLLRLSPGCSSLITGNLKELAYCLPEMDVFVAGDTGPLHVSSALKVKTIGLFGPSSPAVFGVRGEHTYNIWKSIDCAPCCEPETFHYMEFLKCANNICMKEISVAEVKAVVDEMLKKKYKASSLTLPLMRGR